MANELGSIVVKLGLDAGGLSGGLAAATSKLASFAAGVPGMLGPVATIGIAVGAAIVGIGIASVAAAGDFQQAGTLLVTSAGESAKNIEMVKQGILQMAVDTGTSTDMLMKGMFNIESSGFRGRDALQVESAAARGAKVENSDLVATTDVLTTAMHNYHLGASKAVDVMNSFRMSAAAGKMHMDDLTGALKNVLPIASMAGVQLTDVEAALSTMSNAGDKGAAAGTHLSQMLTYLLAPSKKATGVLTEVGLTTQKIADEMKVSLPGAVEMITDAVGKKFPVGSAKYIAALSAIVGGNKSMKAMLELSGISLKEFADDASALAPTMKSASTSIDGFAAVQENFNFKMDQAKAAIETTSIRIGTLLLPLLSRMLDGVLPLIAGFGKWATSSNGLSGIFTALGQAWQGVMAYLNGDAFQGFVADVQTLGQQLQGVLGPAFATLAGNVPSLGNALKGVGQAFAWIIDKVDLVVFGVSQVIRFFQRNQWACDLLVAALVGVSAVLLTLAGIAIAAFLATVPMLVLGFGLWAIGALEAAAATLLAIAPFVLIGIVVALVVFGIIMAVQHWGQITHWLSGVWGAFSSWFMALMGSIGAFFTQKWNEIANFFGGIGAKIVGFFDSMKAGATQKASELGTNVQKAMKAGAQWASDAWHTGVTTVVGWFTWMYNHNHYWHDMVEDIKVIIKWVTTWLPIIWRDTIQNIVMQWNRLVGAAHSAWNATVAAFHSVVDPAVAWLQNAWRTSVDFVQTQWGRLVGAAHAAWNATVAAFHSVVDPAVAWLQSTWSSSVQAIQTQWGRLAGFASDAWTRVAAIFQGIWQNDIAGPLGELWNQISGWFARLGGMAAQSGQNFVSMLASGISSGAGQIWDAVKGIAANIWSALGFHSPAEKGPASDADVWMPNLIKMLVGGLNAGGPQMQQAAQNVAQPLKQQLQYPVRPSGNTSQAASGGTSQTARGGDIHTHVYLDGQEIMHTVMTSADAYQRLKNGNRSTRAA